MDYFGITEQDSDQAAREKIAGRLLVLDEALQDALAPTFEFLGVPDPEHPAPRIDPDARQRQLFAIVKRVVEAHSRREPGVTLLEDLHWFDRGSEAFLEVLVETATTTRSLLVVNFRPEYPRGLDAEVLLPAATTSAAHGRERQRDASRPARNGSVAGRPRCHDP